MCNRGLPLVIINQDTMKKPLENGLSLFAVSFFMLIFVLYCFGVYEPNRYSIGFFILVFPVCVIMMEGNFATINRYSQLVDEYQDMMHGVVEALNKVEKARKKK